MLNLNFEHKVNKFIYKLQMQDKFTHLNRTKNYRILTTHKAINTEI